MLPDVESGIIVQWSGSVGTIPTDWALCDGNNGTPDLRNKFVLGTDTPGGSGGSATHVHTDGYQANGHLFPYVGYGQELAGAVNYNTFSAVALENLTTDPASSLPIYYALAYIMKL